MLEDVQNYMMDAHCRWRCLQQRDSALASQLRLYMTMSHSGTSLFIHNVLTLLLRESGVLKLV
jgi:hypothetical protein